MFMLYLIMFLAFFSPGFMIPGLAQLWAADIPLLLVLAWRLFVPPQISLEYKSYMTRMLMLPMYVFMAWLVIITILTLNATQFVSVPMSLFSLIGRFRPLLFLLLLIPYASDESKLYKLNRLIMSIFIFQAIVVICQKCGIVSINEWYTPRFRPLDAELSYMYSMGLRTIGTIGNPNSMGTFLSVAAMLGFSTYALGKGLKRWMGLFATIVSFVLCVFFASTRQGALSIIMGCALLSFIALLLGKIGRVSFVIVLVILLSPVLMFYLFQNAYLFERFAILRGAAGITDVGSIQTRLMLWPEFFETYGAWIYCGKGMAGQLASEIWDSGWLFLIVAGGIPIVIIYLWWLLRIATECIKTLPYRFNNPGLLGFLLAGPAVSFIVIITNIVNNTYNDTRISLYIGMVYVLTLGTAYQLKYGDKASLEYLAYDADPESYGLEQNDA
jgi:hypothetical protein